MFTSKLPSLSNWKRVNYRLNCSLLLKSNGSFGVYTTDMAQNNYVFLAYSFADKRLLCKTFTYGK